jgi:hypothetical protein
MLQYMPQKMGLTKYLFFTGKGGVGKTTTACATGMTFLPSCAKETAVAQAVVVLPTPPFPVKNRYLVNQQAYNNKRNQ